MQLRVHIAAVFALLTLAAPALGAPTTVLFNGVDGFGVDEQDALDAAAAFGIPIVTPGFVGEADPVLAIISQDVDAGSIDPFPPLGPGPHTGFSEWQVQNQSATDLLGDTYVIFVTPVPVLYGGQLVDYGDANVGLIIDPADGWTFVKVSVPTVAGPGSDAQVEAQDYYYPALDAGSLAANGIATFDVGYFVDSEIQQVGIDWVLPQVQIGMGFTPIPEPHTGLLVGLGLAGLALTGRRRP